ncbi:MAG: histidine phosphatase family protein [Nitrosomonadales bacterium]|nr:histidine phosphatase family protein [Nitrosomonadales bacterium]
MKIILVRHGESEGNVKNEINDDPGRIVNLTARGRAQAAATAERLREMPFTHAYVSQFPRAQQTAAILLQHHTLDLHIDARLNERISGMDGLHVDVFNDLVRPDYLHIKPPGGESFIEQMGRLRSFLDEAATRHPDAVVLAVSHENPIVAALCLTSTDPAATSRRGVVNCEWVELEWPAAR